MGILWVFEGAAASLAGAFCRHTRRHTDSDYKDDSPSVQCLWVVMDSSIAPTLVAETPRLPPRASDANKGLYGRALVVAGSWGMSGAAVLCSSAALRGGAGLVRVAVPHAILPLVATANPCYMTAGLPQDDRGRLSGSALAELREQFRWCTVGVIGPGLGTNPDLGVLLRTLLAETTQPLVLDADALNALVPHLDVLKQRQGPLILTPHPGEFARLTGLETSVVQAQRQELALQFAQTHRVILVLKGAGTVVTDGRRVYVNRTGNPGMATGGTGDVLGGLIAALVGQGMPPFEAAQLGVHLHGRAGDLARDRLGEASLIASDLLEYVPAAFLEQSLRPG
jgi:ADP-dependent NAD(P)H-hydrate dehydratase